MADNLPNNDESTAFINQLKELYEAGKYREAVELFRDFLRPNIGNNSLEFRDVINEVLHITTSVNQQKSIAENCHVCALANYFLNEFAKAIEDCNKAIDLSPEYTIPYVTRGSAYNTLKQYDKAIEDFSKAIKLDPKYVSAYNNRGYSYNHSGQNDKALADFSKAIDLDPEEALSYNNRGVSYDGLKQYDKAIEDFSKAIELDPEYDNAYRNRADTYAELKQYDNAISDYTRIITHSKNEFYINLAKSKLEEIEKQKDAEEYKPISDLVTEIKDLLIFKDSRVTHYSGLSTVRPLVFDNSKFRLSEGSFLNDTSEGRILFHFLEVEQQAKNESIAEMFIEKPFIGSFVADTKSDDLTLWRMYGKEAQEEAKGCSITMDSKKFLEDLNAAYIPENKEIARDIEKEDIFQFFRVAYLTNEKEQKFIIPSESEAKEQALNELMGRLKQKIKDINLGSIKEKTAQNIKEKLAEVAYLFKSIEYQYEHEVRLIVSLSTLFKRKINTNRTPPGVYIELVDILPSVCRITLGPKVVLAEEWAAALHYDITNKGYQAEVFVSHLPYK